jgi:branched-chain amino acid transport system ATP-binding protein/urea transport system ATP-binding protein
MSGGQQQQLAIMRALVGEPKLLLLDEPSEGIQPSIVQEIARTLRRTAQEKQLTVLLVEQNLDLVLGMASRSLFMENGRVVDEAPVEKIRLSSEFVEKYLSV